MTIEARKRLHDIRLAAEALCRFIAGKFARFLQQQADDRAWERILSDPRPRPKLDKFVADALREGSAEPPGISKLIL